MIYEGPQPTSIKFPWILTFFVLSESFQHVSTGYWSYVYYGQYHER